MLKLVTNLTLNQRLALLAFVLGLVAIGATPARGGRVAVDPRDMAWRAANGSDRVAARALADWIVQGRSDFRLVDIRTPTAFAAGPRIPSAENIPLGALFDADLDRGEKILLVGDDQVAVAQAWLLLEASGYSGASVVDGGLAAWRDQVFHPRVDGVDATTRTRLEAVSAHFGGSPRTGGGADALPTTSAPGIAQAAPVVPKLPPPGGKKPAPAKKREGC
jgi:rhodanese-related sulfurtransferase